MKKYVFLLFVGAVCLSSAGAQSAGTVEVSFTYTRQGGFASNQFAVWIEDARGNFVKTLYATRFTVRGGYEKRPQSIPEWVRKSGLAGLGRTQADAISGATPRTGRLSYRWNGTDQSGRAVPPGEYRVCVEGSLRDAYRVLYGAPVRLGGNAGDAAVETQYFGQDAVEKAMIRDVKVSYTP
jgi:hypothetical protein